MVDSGFGVLRLRPLGCHSRGLHTDQYLYCVLRKMFYFPFYFSDVQYYFLQENLIRSRKIGSNFWKMQIPGSQLYYCSSEEKSLFLVQRNKFVSDLISQLLYTCCGMRKSPCLRMQRLVVLVAVFTTCFHCSCFLSPVKMIKFYVDCSCYVCHFN